MDIIECLKNISVAWIYFAMLFFLAIGVFIWFFKCDSGRYCYGRWLGHKMAIRIGLSIALGFLLLAVPFMLVCYNSISLQENEIASGLIQSIGTIITGIGVVAAYVLQSDENNRQNTLKYTTESRSKWMDDGRQLTSELCEAISAYLVCFSKKKVCSDKEELLSNYNKLNRLIPSLYMRFNFNGARDRVLLVLLERIHTKIKNIQSQFEESGILPTKEKSEEISNLLKIFILHLQIYYKVEWERLKMEVKYVGNVEARDYYIKEKMVDLRNLYYKNQAIREQTLFPDGIPYNVIDLSVITVYLKLIGAELKISEGIKIRYAKRIELEQREKIMKLTEIQWFTRSCGSDAIQDKVKIKDIEDFETGDEKKHRSELANLFLSSDTPDGQRAKIRLHAHEILKW